MVSQHTLNLVLYCYRAFTSELENIVCRARLQTSAFRGVSSFLIRRRYRSHMSKYKSFLVLSSQPIYE
jgi:hypothetical protein